MSAVYYVGSCDYTQVEKSLASETNSFEELNFGFNTHSFMYVYYSYSLWLFLLVTRLLNWRRF